MTDLQVWYTVGVIALVTAGIRFSPFLVWNGKRKTPSIIGKLSALLPFAVMGMLVVYCLKDVHFASLSGFAPTVIACSVVGALYVWKRNTLISIAAGTVCYMLLVQWVF